MRQSDLLGCDRLAVRYGHYGGADIEGKFTTNFWCFNTIENHNN